MNMPQAIHLWRPRGDEHAVAASLGLCDADPNAVERSTEALRADAEKVFAGVPVRVHRFHVWRVVRAMVRLGVTNTSEGRAAAIGWLGSEGGDGE